MFQRFEEAVRVLRPHDPGKLKRAFAAARREGGGAKTSEADASGGCARDGVDGNPRMGASQKRLGHRLVLDFEIKVRISHIQEHIRRAIGR